MATLPNDVCPDCLLRIDNAYAFADHRGDMLCLAEQARSKIFADATVGWRRAGQTFPTMSKAGVKFKYLPFGFLDNRPHNDYSEGNYVRCAPHWAVFVSELTSFTPARRIKILQHCLASTEARDVVRTIMRLGVVGSLRKGVKRKSAKRVNADQLFKDVMFADLDET